MASTVRHFLTFAAFGVLGTLCHFAVLALGVDVLGMGPVAGSSLGAIAGALVNYALNYRWNYRSQAEHRVALTRFLAVAGVGFVLNALGMEVLAVRLGIYYLLAQAITTALVLLWNFSANHFWTFGADVRR